MKTTIKTRKNRIPSWDELREMFKETDKKFQETDKKFQETDRQFKETDKKFRETEKEIQETKEIVKETSRKVEETSRNIDKMREEIRESDKKYRELADQFTSTIGHIAEGLMEPEAVRIFQEAGFDIDRYHRNMKKKNKQNQNEMEVDLVMLNCTLAIVVEIKTDCRKKDIDHFLRQMPKFRNLFPEFRDKEILAAVAALNYDRDAANYAHEQGLLVISTTDGDNFTLEPSNRESLKRF